ncbi:hypothetical protein LQ50_05185 [Halalkalibacter okhensis]|uniref:Uncharacterized protein n=2 Tax=Halalkalibacter okhensis TaxID=333138 RepID=A0A0B0IJT3_9BACI|nr:hypothetical protein LQ50_05185 [Halalkalibacter okhensis]
MVTFLSIGILISVLGICITFIHKRSGMVGEILFASTVVGWTFHHYSFPDVFIALSIASSSYFAMYVFTDGRKKTREIKDELFSLQVKEIELHRENKRVIIDVLITGFIFLGAIMFLLYGPEEGSVMKFLIMIGFATMIPELIKRIVSFLTVRAFYGEENEYLYVVTPFESRKYPLADIEHLSIESSVDLLKLHPLLTLFSSNTDFTTSFRHVLSLRFPGETSYLTVKDSSKWYDLFQSKRETNETLLEQHVSVLPFYHKSNLKRLLGKLYFACTVKGISAYTSLILVLMFLNTPVWMMIVIGLLFWTFNLYVSDRVLKVAMDAKEVADQRVLQVADRIFTKAGIPNVNVYETDSTQYNGLATGMNIGRSMVTLTSATLKLPIESIEAILAHEAVHVKKRDVLFGQLLKIPYLLLIIGVVVLLQQYVSNIAENMMPIFFLLWLMMLLFPIQQSFYLQWMELRADYLGAAMLEGGPTQMAEGLAELASRQDEAAKKVIEYGGVEGKKESPRSSLERSNWFLRFLEFQLMPHPPTYWRIQILRDPTYVWGRRLIHKWLVDRTTESFFWR